MIDTILRWLYRRFAAKFDQIMVDEYVKDIPKEVVDEGFSVMATQKHKLTRLTDYLAYSLHKKMASDGKNSARYQGMFVQLKILTSMIAGRPDVKKEAVDPLKKEEPNKFQEHLNNATDFAKDLIKSRRG